MMRLNVDLTEEDIRNAVVSYIEEKYGIELSDDLTLTIEVKSKQNYKSEWEVATYRGIVRECK